jgi:transcription termination factor Rho
MHLSDLKALHISQLIEMAQGLEIENANRMRKQELMFAILKRKAKLGESIFGDGVLEILPDGFGFLRTPETSYLASPDDIYISPSQIRRFNLHTGDAIEGEVRTPKDGERYFALVKVDKINDQAPEASKNKILFENLVPLHPDQMLHLERDMNGDDAAYRPRAKGKPSRYCSNCLIDRRTSRRSDRDATISTRRSRGINL